MGLPAGWCRHWIFHLTRSTTDGSGKKLNTKIIVATIIIAASGIIRAWTDHKPITYVVIGSYVLLVILSVMDMFGGGLSELASALAMLAATYVILTEFPWQQLINLVQGKKVA